MYTCTVLHSKYVVYEGCIHDRLARSLRSSTVYFRAFFTNPRFLYSSLLLIHPFRSLLAPITSLSISSYGLYVVPHDSVLQVGAIAEVGGLFDLGLSFRFL
ncbi:hypothetical protein B296_00032205 [Ensete ventricosum]|uniref:Uncharacterized protein n=1 Tax=Ensete ventricosum TaxID=4639 RepID=A0A426YF74_ENSVE|nr:hypothetical protein B296_00032205 [Ensete ventricosum]